MKHLIFILIVSFFGVRSNAQEVDSFKVRRIGFPVNDLIREVLSFSEFPSLSQFMLTFDWQRQNFYHHLQASLDASAASRNSLTFGNTPSKEGLLDAYVLYSKQLVLNSPINWIALSVGPSYHLGLNRYRNKFDGNNDNIYFDRTLYTGIGALFQSFFLIRSKLQIGTQFMFSGEFFYQRSGSFQRSPNSGNIINDNSTVDFGARAFGILPTQILLKFNF